MIYPIKTLSQLPLILKGFRKEKGLTQAAIAARLGITQQSYAYFEANPATATIERLFLVLRMLDVEISLDQSSLDSSRSVAPPISAPRKSNVTIRTIERGVSAIPSNVAKKNVKPSTISKVTRIVTSTRKKEPW